MNKSFKIIRGIKAGVGIGSEPFTTTITDQMLQNYETVTGVFVTPFDASQDLSLLTCSLKIAQNEVLPLDFDLSLIAFTGEVSLLEACYDFKAENIPSRSSEMEFTVTNPTGKEVMFNLYLRVENK